MAENLRQSILSPADFPELFKFSRHTPSILLKQTINSQAFNFFKKHVNNFSIDFSSSSYLSPSIERFWGALLFVDISGFTVLSTKMNVDDLRLHINTYFDKIISYADKYEGQTVKFAGDALYIIWQSPVTELPEDPFSQRAISEDVVRRAVACALEINQNLSDYKIVFVPSIGTTTAITATANTAQDAAASANTTAAATSSTAPAPAATNTAANTAADSHEEIAYLNVHSGLSVGMMAGLDVGANDRWEFLLVGDPLGDVAAAEDSAKKGELIISERAHEILHPSRSDANSYASSRDKEEEEGKGGDAAPVLLCQDVNTELPCSCILRKPGCYLVRRDLALALETHQASRRTSLLDANSAYVKKTCQLLIDAFLDAFTAWREMLKASSKEIANDTQLSLVDLRQELVKILKHEAHALTLSVSPTASVLDHFRSWAFYTLSATLAAHVHQTAREGFDFSSLRHLQTFSEVIHAMHKHNSFVSPATPMSISLPAIVSPRTHASSTAYFPSSSNLNASTPHANKANRLMKGSPQEMRLGHMETDLTAELRNVIVLFIKIDINFGDWQKKLAKGGAGVGERQESVQESKHSNKHSITRASHMIGMNINSNLSLSGLLSSANINTHTQHSHSQSFVKEKDINPVSIPSFHFLSRSKEELAVDHALLHKFQKCMDILTTIFVEKGGHLRQFIVDDKGTVCIGTFGLRGAVNYDDAAAAIEAAKSIIMQMRDHKMQAGIGITSGKAYCGLVGSPTRHEYAVMGPSVNLSARLMSKASYLQILCDEEIKTRDRVHDFTDLGDITAKGYARPVRIYSPVLPELLYSRNSKSRHHHTTILPMGMLPTPSSANLLAQPQGPQGNSNPNTAVSTAGTSRDRTESKDKAINRRRVRNSFLTEHLRSSFNINSESNVSLYGRKSEIDALLRLLLKKFSYPVSSSSSSTGLSPLLNTSSNSFFVCIEGVCGIGKTIFLNEVCRSIAKVNEAHSKVAVFRKRVSSYSSSEPFHAWRRIFRDMMAFLFRIETEKQREEERKKARAAEKRKREKEEKERAARAKEREERGETEEKEGEKTEVENERQESPQREKEQEKEKEVPPVDQVLQGVKMIETAMNEEAGDIMSLLSSINFLPIESENASDIESLGPLSLLRSVDMLAKIVHTFVVKTKHLIVIAFDDLQWIDFYSWLLMQKVWQEIAGAAILATYQTVSSAGRVNKRNVSASSFVNVRETFVDPDRTHIVELGPIDAPAIELLVKDVLERNNFRTTNKDKLYALIYELSGGNPLYAYELIKVCVDQAQHNPALLSLDPSLCSFVKDFKSNRVEEVIYFRFDQLDATSQTVLKVSSIACVFGAPVSVPMLEFLILEDADESDDPSAAAAATAALVTGNGGGVGDLRRQVSYRQTQTQTQGATTAEPVSMLRVLRTLLVHNEFLAMVVREKGDEGFGFAEEKRSMNRANSNNNSSTHNGSGHYQRPTPYSAHSLAKINELGGGDNAIERLALLDDSLLRDTQFEFQASIEQHAIYDLMLEDQKLFLHRRVAAYYEKIFETRRGGRGTSNELYECGLHLEAAQLYHEAFPYFFRSAAILQNLGSTQMAQQQLERAHMLLRQMKSQLSNSGSNNHTHTSSVGVGSLSRHNSRRFSVASFMLPNLSDIERETEEGESEREEPILSSVSAYRTEGRPLLDEKAILRDRQGMLKHAYNRKSLSDISKALQSAEEDIASLGLLQVTLQDAYRMFHGRVDLLETAIRVVLGIAQHKLLTFQEVNAAAAYYEEAVHLIFVSFSARMEEDRQRQRRRELRERERDRLPSRTASESEFLSARQGGDASESVKEDSDSARVRERREREEQLLLAESMRAEDEALEQSMTRSAINGRLYYSETSIERFYVQDFTLLFRALTGIIYLYRLGYVQDEKSGKKEREAIRMYLELSAPAQPVPEAYLEQAGLAFQRHWLFSHNAMAEERAVVEQIIRTYRLEQSKDILQVNLFDPVLPALGSALQMAVLSKDTAQTDRLLAYLIPNVREVTHASTMAMIMSSLCSSLVLLGRAEEANELYTKVYLPLDEDAHVLNKFTDMKKPIGEWLRLVKHADNCGTDFPGEGDVAYYFPNKIMLRVICNPKTRHTLARIRPITHCCLDMMGLGKELVYGAILLFHVMMSLKYNNTSKRSAKEEPTERCLQMSKFYLEQSLSNTSVRAESYFFCRAMSFLLKIRVVAMMHKCTPTLMSAEEAMREVDMCAREVQAMMARKSCDFALLREVLEKVKRESLEMLDPAVSSSVFDKNMQSS